METTEQFLQYLWKYRLLQPPLICVSGEPLEVLHPGIQNRDGGPDFFNARIRIGNTVWAGNVEIHLRASDWYRHHHQDNPAYRNVILHVVENCDTEIPGAGNSVVPVVEVRNSYSQLLSDRFEALRAARTWIPCRNIIREIDPGVFAIWASALVVERLTNRVNYVKNWISETGYRWDEVTFQLFAGAMGCKVNSHQFEMLARATPHRLLNRHRDNLMIIEALLFGQASLLTHTQVEDYPIELRRIYSFYRDKYTLVPLEPGTMKFLRLRPMNFPTLRISQLASLIHKYDSFPENFLESIPIGDLTGLLQVEASGFWNTHYTFDRISAFRVKKLGQEAIRLLLINGLSPLLFLYGTERNQVSFRERALAVLEITPGESSAMISEWTRAGLPSGNALFTQALRQLKGEYCDRRRCLECRIGKQLLK